MDLLSSRGSLRVEVGGSACDCICRARRGSRCRTEFSRAGLTGLTFGLFANCCWPTGKFAIMGPALPTGAGGRGWRMAPIRDGSIMVGRTAAVEFGAGIAIGAPTIASVAWLSCRSCSSKCFFVCSNSSSSLRFLSSSSSRVLAWRISSMSLGSVEELTGITGTIPVLRKSGFT